MKSYLVLLLVIVPSILSAEPRTSASGQRGLITTSACPYSCADEGLSASECKEWSEGGRCFTENLTQPPGHRTRMTLPSQNSSGAETAGRMQASSGMTMAAAGQRGLVTTARCPYSCADERLSPELCREWRSGDNCNVEDLTQPPGHRTMMRVLN